MIKTVMADYAARAEAALYNMMPSSDCVQKTVVDAMKYSIEAGGKRLRPMIMLMTAKLLDLDEAEAMPFACALEMIHTYSLIHDDLPSMDNDDLRRGKPTNHKVFGEAMAILAGDGLLNLAAETVSKAETSTLPERKLKAIGELFTASGFGGMIGGQVVDLESEGKRISPEEMQTIHLMKTGALIRAAGRIPCALAGASEEDTKAITAYCDNLGVAFQICDDLLDVYGTTEELGKAVGSDEQNEKSTYVTLFGKEKAEELMRVHTEKAKENLSRFGEKAEELILLAEYLTGRKN